MTEESWFSTWFNSPYYHVLYQRRDKTEADALIPALIERLGLQPGSKVLDLACGKGRHARAFHRSGMRVTGLDLAQESIAYARKHSPGEIRFEVGDMRSFNLGEDFDLVANLFTSFGYFDHSSDNLRVLESVKQHLRPEGCLVIDFLNLEKVRANLQAESTQVEQGITFNIRREIVNGIIRKRIAFRDGDQDYAFEERVQALGLEDFETMIEKADLRIQHTFGNYRLEPYDPDAERLIIVALQGDDCDHGSSQA